MHIYICTIFKTLRVLLEECGTNPCNKTFLSPYMRSHTLVNRSYTMKLVTWVKELGNVVNEKRTPRKREMMVIMRRMSITITCPNDKKSNHIAIIEKLIISFNLNA